MIQPLRVAHRIAFVGLTVVLPAILCLGIGARSSWPGAGALVAGVPATANVVRESAFYSRSDRPQETHVVLQSAQDLNAPDLLLYWADNAPQGNALPGAAKLVGSFRAGKAFLIPVNEKAYRVSGLVQLSASERVRHGQSGEVAMSVQYGAISWNRQKRVYDLTLVSLVTLYLAIFV